MSLYYLAYSNIPHYHTIQIFRETGINRSPWLFSVKENIQNCVLHVIVLSFEEILAEKAAFHFSHKTYHISTWLSVCVVYFHQH